MLRSSVSRLTTLSIGPRTNKLSTQQLIAASPAQELFSQLQKHEANLEKALGSTKARIDSSCVNEVLRRCTADLSISGLRFFIWAGIQSNYKHSSHMYRKACKIFRIQQNPGSILDVLESYRVAEFPINLRTVKVVLNLCREANLANEALWVLRTMGDFNLGADTVVYNIVIRLFCQKGDMDTAESLMREMGSAGLSANMITFMLMIRGLCDVGKLDAASKLFEELKEQGCAPNVVVFSALLDGFCGKANLEKALELLSEMEKGDEDCRPNTVSYTSVIHSFCIQGLLSSALVVLDRMISHGCAPNRVTVRVLFDALCADGREQEVDELIDKVVVCGSVSIADCNSCLIISLIRVEKLEEAERQFRLMLSHDMRPDAVTCNMILRELCSKGRPFDAFLIIKEIEKAGFSAFIGHDVFSALIMGLYELNHREEALTLAKLMLARGIKIQAPYSDEILKCMEKKWP
ncbi:hypothetical protein SAY86_000707 [Trapa natans]|uniref:Pentatricopeptide repeat-containing protein n=1 Tax=Trapa natans TaxID=22666 RepID=A0AAN7RE39_TRANT|nr:hypothetical protein SAY86_000707 [Trapa natans]